MLNTSDGQRTNILPWPKDLAAQALLASRGDELMGQLEMARSFMLDRPAILLAVAAALGFILGRIVGR
ncbi:MAG: hypothetical protein KGJ86_21115, partial [Chloroflexota bacterium]|nr:hypothetical protein [Chloroflexota bacterium]